MKQRIKSNNFFLSIIGLFFLLKTNYAQNSMNGWILSPSGNYRILVIYAEVVDNAGTPIGNTSNWPAGSYPLWCNNWVANSIGTSAPNEYFSRAYYQNSLGNLKITGDYLINPILPNKPIQVPNTSGISLESAVTNAINNNAQFTSFLTHTGNSSLSPFDLWSISGKTSYQPSIMTSNNKGDHLMIIFKGGQNYTGTADNCGYFSPGSLTILGKTFESYSVFRADNDVPLAIAQHEFAHSLIGANDWHTAGDGYQTTHWTMHGGGGWGLLGLYGNSFMTASAHDRYRLGWTTSGRIPQKIYARNNTNSSDLISDIDPYNSTQQGEYILRDFSTTGDALRIRLPYLDNGEAPQYIWIENHQTKANNNEISDDYFWRTRSIGSTPISCLESPTAGLYSYIQLGEDKLTSNFSQISQYTYQLAADGNHDYSFNTIPQEWCIGPANHSYSKIKPNPLSGLPDLYFQPWDNNGDNNITFRECIDLGKDLSDLTTRLPKNGDSRDAFTYLGNKKINMFSNPSTCPIITSISNNNIGITSTLENRTVYLNGVSIEITNQSNGLIKVNIKLDDRSINGANLRWASDKIILNRTSNTIVPANGNMLSIDNSVLTIDRSLTNNRHGNPNVINGRKLFNNPTLFYIKGLTNFPCIMEVKNNSTVTLDENSSMEIQPNGVLKLTNSTLIIKNNSVLDLQLGGNLELNGSSKIIVQSGGKLLYNGGTLKLNDNTSIVEIQDGYLEIASGKTFSFTGLNTNNYGFIRFNSTLNPSNNIIAGVGSAFDLSGSNKTKTKMEVLQESVYLPQNLSLFKVNNASVLMSTNSRVHVAGSSVAVNILNARFGSITGLKTNHRGLSMLGQTNVSISNSTFENGNYGIYDWLTTYGSSHTFNNCSFINNTIGLFTHDRGITLNSCSFIKNNQYGCYSESMNINSYVTGCTFGGSTINANGTALYFNGSSSVSVKIDASIVNNNNNGIVIDGSYLFVHCGEVKNNTNYGFEVKNDATLDMGDNWYTDGSFVDARNNGTTIKCNNALNVDLINGYNYLMPLVQGQQKTINGTLDRGCSSFILQATKNQWNLNGTGLNPSDYKLNTLYYDVLCGPAASVIVMDSLPSFYSNCSIATITSPAAKKSNNLSKKNILNSNDISLANNLNDVTDSSINSIIIKPNPIDKVLSLILPESGEAKIYIMDVFGKQVKMIYTDIINPTINLEDLNNGIYYIQVYQNEKNYQSKLIKQ